MVRTIIQLPEDQAATSRRRHGDAGSQRQPSSAKRWSCCWLERAEMPPWRKRLQPPAREPPAWAISPSATMLTSLFHTKRSKTQGFEAYRETPARI